MPNRALAVRRRRPLARVAPAHRKGLRVGALLAWAAMALLLAWPGRAPAASFQVSPTRFEFSLERRFTNYFTVTNNSTEELRLRVTTAYLEADADGKLIEKPGSPHDLSPWIVLNPRRITLGPSEKRVVRFSVRPQPGLPPGEYRTVVFFEELPPRPQERSEPASGLRIQLLTRLGVTIYGSTGDAAPEPHLDEARAAMDGAALTIRATLRNAGTAHVTLLLVATLLDVDGKEQGRIEQPVTVQRGQSLPIRLALEPARPAMSGDRVHIDAKAGERTLVSLDVPVAESGR